MKILALCDSPTMTTGFARVAQNLFRRWHAAGATIDVWGIGFAGWGYKEHPYVNVFLPAGAGGKWCDPLNLTLFIQQLNIGGYTHVWIMQDTFLLSPNGFPKALRKMCKERNVHSVLYFPVDAPLEPKWTEIISSVKTPVAYTEYGKTMSMAAQEAAEFYHGRKIEVIPHGVDATIYQPKSATDRAYLRDHFWNEKWLTPDDFLLVNVNMNQRRKDVARSLEILSLLIRRGVPAKLLMHMPESSVGGLKLEAAGAQLGLRLDVDWSHHDKCFRGSQSQYGEAKLVELYNIADCYLTTTLGEGWGLGITEALACGLPVAVPRHTACEEIAEGLKARGMGDRVIPMMTEKHALFLEDDNTRWRQRTDVEDAANQIAQYYDSGKWRERPELNAEVREWLSWDRVAAEFLRLMGMKPVDVVDVQTSAEVPA